MYEIWNAEVIGSDASKAVIDAQVKEHMDNGFSRSQSVLKSMHRAFDHEQLSQAIESLMAKDEGRYAKYFISQTLVLLTTVETILESPNPMRAMEIVMNARDLMLIQAGVLRKLVEDVDDDPKVHTPKVEMAMKFVGDVFDPDYMRPEKEVDEALSALMQADIDQDLDGLQKE